MEKPVVSAVRVCIIIDVRKVHLRWTPLRALALGSHDSEAILQWKKRLSRRTKNWIQRALKMTPTSWVSASTSSTKILTLIIRNKVASLGLIMDLGVSFDA